MGNATNRLDIQQESNTLDQTEPLSLNISTEHYAELTVTGFEAAATVSTGNYASSGGTVVMTVPKTPVLANTPGQSHVTIFFDPLGGGTATRIEEVFLDRCN